MNFIVKKYLYFSIVLLFQLQAIEQDRPKHKFEFINNEESKEIENFYFPAIFFRFIQNNDLESFKSYIECLKKYSENQELCSESSDDLKKEIPLDVKNNNAYAFKKIFHKKIKLITKKYIFYENILPAALTIACEEGNSRFVEYLVRDLGVNCNAIYVELPIWHKAVINGHREIVQWLLMYDFVQLDSKKTALDVACKYLNGDMAKLLLDNVITDFDCSSALCKVFDAEFDKMLKEERSAQISSARLEIVMLFVKKGMLRALPSLKNCVSANRGIVYDQLHKLIPILERLFIIDEVVILRYLHDNSIINEDYYAYIFEKSMECCAIKCMQYALHNGFSTRFNPWICIIKNETYDKINFLMNVENYVNEIDAFTEILPIDGILTYACENFDNKQVLLHCVHAIELLLQRGLNFALSKDPDFLHKIVLLNNVALVEECIKTRTPGLLAVAKAMQELGLNGKTAWEIAQKYEKNEILEFIRNKTIKEAECVACGNNFVNSQTLLTPCYGCLCMLCNVCVESYIKKVLYPKCINCRRPIVKQ